MSPMTAVKRGPARQTPFFALGGGLDLVTPALVRKPGAALWGSNYEPQPTGYERFRGFERTDGHPLPSSASYWTLDYDAGTVAFVAGDTVTGATSGATGYVIFTGSLASGTLILTDVTGTFVDNEALQVTAVTRATAASAATERGSENDDDDATNLQAAIEIYRARIAAVPGEGSVLGVWSFNGVDYAFRNNVGSTAARMYKSTAAGWVQVSLGFALSYTAGTEALAAGVTITGASSGATAVLKRQTIRTGTFAGSSAAGQLIFASVTGTFTNGENLQVTAATKATASGSQAAITLAPGGHYEFKTHNFYGASNLRRVYGVSGTNKAFEFDGTTYVPIATGMTTDTPNHLAIHGDYLVLSFPGGSIQNSSLGEPTQWTLLTGASERGLGDEVTAMQGDYYKAVVIFGRNSLATLAGTVLGSGGDAVFTKLSLEAGALEWSHQPMSMPTVLDDRGLRTINTTVDFGDFQAGTHSTKIEPLLASKRRSDVTVTASVRSRTKNLYRLFFSDGSALSMLYPLGQREAQFMPLDLGMTVRCACSAEDANGKERLLFGSDDGFVYLMDSGTALDGDEMSYLLRLPFNNCKSPALNKRFHKAVLEMQAPAGATIGVSGEFSYGNPDLPSMENVDFSVFGSGFFWNENGFWNEAYWSQVEGTAEADADGFGQSVSFAISGGATYEAPHTIHGITIHYTPRGIQR